MKPDKRLKFIKLLVVDIDGVMTDGKLYFGDAGEMMKCFHIQDGYGLMKLRRAGIPTMMVSGKESPANRHRAKDLGIERIYENIQDKGAVIDEIKRDMNLESKDICYIGDDTIDLPAMRKAGFAVAVANAVDEVKEAADAVTEKEGGNGAVREVVDQILKYHP
jgi:3-deoxy-D-manno-octulosonate 8-phosphate phosphatase (KDO 8-P phosphatase)